MRLLATRLTAIASAVKRLFSPASLFRNSEQGVWYDPSDFSTLFQDSAGTTPVTAVEQPVGLILDKSKGLVLGAELVTNGGFDSNTTGWNPRAGCTLSVVAGWLRLTYTGSGAARANFTTLTTVVGKTYKIIFNVRNTTSTGTAGGFVYSDAFVTQIATSGSKRADDSYSFVFTATSTTSNIEVGNSASDGGAGAYLEFDNISVRELPGNHATQATSASRPVLKQDANGKYYLFFDGVDDALATGEVTLGATPFISTALSIAAVNTYPGPFRFLRTGGSPTATTANLLEEYSPSPYTRKSVVQRYPSMLVVRDAIDRPASPGVHVSWNNVGDSTGVVASDRNTTFPTTAINGGAGTLHLGESYGGGFMSGRVYQFIWRNQQVTPSQLSAVNAYFKAKAGITP